MNGWRYARAYPKTTAELADSARRLHATGNIYVRWQGQWVPIFRATPSGIRPLFFWERWLISWRRRSAHTPGAPNVGP